MKALVLSVSISQLRTGLLPVTVGRRIVGGGPFGAQRGC